MCPVGCTIEVVVDENGKVVEVIGGLCERGREFARKTAGENMQIVTTTVKLSVPVGEVRVIPVKTTEPVPVSEMQSIVSLLKRISVNPPIKAGDVITQVGTNKSIKVIATRSVDMA